MHKNSVIIRVPIEMIAFEYGGEWLRREKSRTETPPSEEDWADYREAVALLEKLRYNRFYREGGPDYGSEIEEPEPTVHVEYAETEADWKARISKLNPADYKRPDYFSSMAAKYPFLTEAIGLTRGA